MTDHLVALKRLIITLAEFYGTEMSVERLNLYARSLADLNPNEVQEAVLEVLKDPDVRFMPLPAIIRAKIAPPITEESEARESAARILSAVSKYGYTNPTRAREYIGELGWRIVSMQGGWQRVCETLTEDNAGTFQAQWRELAIGQSRKAKLGTLELSPALPECRTAAPELSNFADLLKKLPKLEMES